MIRCHNSYCDAAVTFGRTKEGKVRSNRLKLNFKVRKERQGWQKEAQEIKCLNKQVNRPFKVKTETPNEWHVD